MRFNEFDIVEAPGDNLQRKYNALLAKLKKPSKDEGFFGRNSRRQENAELLAKFAQENNLPGMYDPETGNFVYTEENPDTGEVEVQTSSNASMDSAKDLAGKGLLPDVVKQRFTDQLADTTDIAGNERPEYAKDMQDIFQADAKAKQKQEKSKVQTPNTQQFGNPDDEGTGIPKDIPAKAGAEPKAKPAKAGAEPKAKPAKAGAEPKAKPAASKPAARVSYQDLAKASGIKDANKIRVGQEIKLPGGGTYKVKKGDTLSGIAKSYNSGSIGKPAPSSATPPATVVDLDNKIIGTNTSAPVPAPGGDAAPAGAPKPGGGNQPPGIGPDGKQIGGGTSKPTKPGSTPPKKDDEPDWFERIGNFWRDFKGN